MATIIRPRTGLTTMLNFFEVAEEKLEEALGILVGSTDSHIRHMPGFIAANFHVSRDRTRMLNWVQWENEEKWSALGTDPVGSAEVAAVRKIAKPYPRVHTVAEVILPSGSQDPMRLTADEARTTSIGILTVDPGRSEGMVERVIRWHNDRARRAAGFLASAVLICRDGDRVIEYAQWRDDESLRAFREEEDTVRHDAEIAEECRVDERLWKVHATFAPDPVSA